jgi:hypothetical protein
LDYDAKKNGMDTGGWRENRRRWVRMHNQDYSHRLTGDDKGNIFNFSNVSMDICRTDSMRSAGRLQRDLIDTWPYYALFPQGFMPNPDDGSLDQNLARDMERFAYYKTQQSNLTECLAEAIDTACILGEAVVKTTYRRDVQKYKARATVLCSPAGEPYRTSSQEVIYQTDAWETETNETGVTVKRLVKDPSFIFPPDGVWLEKLVEAEMVNYQGPCSKVVHFESFHAPLNCEDLMQATGLYFDLSVPYSEVLAKYQIKPDEKALPETQNWLRYLAPWMVTAASEDSSPKSPDTIPDYTAGEAENHRSRGEEPQIQIVEGYRQIDIDGDGIPERIMVVIDLGNRELLWWDYLANVTPDGLPPVRVVRKRPRKNRWDGIGDYEEGEVDAEQIDYFVNRSIFNGSMAGQLCGYDESACVDWRQSPPEVGTGQWYKLTGDKKMYEAVTFAQIPKMPDESFEVMNLLLQKHTLSRPSIQPGQQNIANLPSSRLATGIKALMDIADDLYSPQRRCAEKTLTEVIKAHLECLFFHMNDEEAYEYLEGQASFVGRLPKQKVQDLKINVRLTMSRVRNLEASEKAQVARQAILEFYTAIPPQIQKIVAPFYIDQFSAMDIPNGKEYFIPQEETPPVATSAQEGELPPLEAPTPTEPQPPAIEPL